MRKKSSVLLLILVLQACNFSQTRMNNEDDINKGRKFISNFYFFVKSKEQEKAISLFGGDLNDSKARKIFNNVNIYLGDLQSYKEEFGHSRVENKNGQVNERYEFRYTTIYNKGEATETIVLKTINGELKITGYNPIMKLSQ